MSEAKMFLAVKKHPFNLLYLALVGQFNNLKTFESLTEKSTKLATALPSGVELFTMHAACT